MSPKKIHPILSLFSIAALLANTLLYVIPRHQAVYAQTPPAQEKETFIVLLTEQSQIVIAEEVKREYQPRLERLTQEAEAMAIQAGLREAEQPALATPEEEFAYAQQRRAARQVSEPDREAHRQIVAEMEAAMGEMRREIVNQSAASREASQTIAAKLVEDLGGEVIYFYDTVNAMAISISPDKQQLLLENPAIAEVYEDQLTTGSMNVSAATIGADTWWGNGYTGGAWDVAVLDSGIDDAHPALSSQNFVEQRCLDTAGNPAWDPTADDVNGHGTHIAGTIASVDAAYRGIAYGLDVLMNGKAAYDGDGSDGGGAWMYWSDGMACTDWALNDAGQDADIINLSYGGVASVDDNGYERFWDAVVDQKYAVVTISAGNSNIDGSPTIHSPSIAYNVLSVANVNDQNTTTRSDDSIWSTSSRGPTPGGRKKPDIAAPGAAIYSTNNTWEGAEADFVNYWGTSMAAPHIAGAATLIMGHGVSDPMAIKALMINTAEDKGATGWDAEYGWGYIDLNHLDFHIGDYRADYISASPAYHFYAGPAFTNDTATLVWHRRAVYTNTYPSTYYSLTNLNLDMYNEATNSWFSSSSSSIDNVEQVKANGTYGEAVIKVDSYSTGIDGSSTEKYALATEENFSYRNGPALNIVPITVAGDLGGPMSTIINISARVDNTGDLAAHILYLYANISSGLTMLNGNGTNYIGSVDDGSGSITYTWQFQKTNYDPQTVQLSAYSNSYGESFSDNWQISGTAPDNCYAQVASTGLTYNFAQEAVNNAADDDTVKVAGTCAGIEFRGGLSQTVYISKSITLQGGYTTTNWTTPDPVANPTILDAQGKGRVIYVTGNISPTIESLNITGGDATGLQGYTVDGWMGPITYDAGGGVYVITATAILNSHKVFGNAAQDGGGVFLHSSSTQLSNNTVFSNSASNDGGGLFLYSSPAQLSNNIVFSNTASSEGGGLYILNSDTALLSGTIVTTNTSGWRGGGVYLNNSAATLNNNTVTSNTTNYGGGFYLVSSAATLNSNTITANTAEYGGGLYLWASDDTLEGNIIAANIASHGGGLYFRYGTPTLVNNVVSNNQANIEGSGMYIIGSSPRLLHTTIARNSGGDGSGIYTTELIDFGVWYSVATLTNTILISHTVGVTVTAGNTATLNSVLWFGNGTNSGGAGIISISNAHTGDPAFADDGYHLTFESATINKGIDAGASLDIDGDSRPQNLFPDLGADELPIPELAITKTVAAAQTPIYPGDPITYTIIVMNNGTMDVPDVRVTDTLPSGVIGSNLDTVTTITAGGKATFSINAIVADDTYGQIITNTAYYQHIVGNGSTQVIFSGFAQAIFSVSQAIPVAADFSASPTAGTPPLMVNFTNQSSGDYTSSQWDFGDDATSTQTNPSHTYNNPGAYTVTLTVSGPGGVDTSAYTNYIHVHQPVQANFNASPTSGTAPLTVNFTNQSSGDYTSSQWDFGDGGTSNQTNPSHIYNTPNAYTVTLTVSGPGGEASINRIDYINVSPVYNIYLPLVLKNYTPPFYGPWEVEPNDDAKTQANGPIISGQTYYGQFLDQSDKKDYFYITLLEAHTIEIWLSNIPSGQDYDLVLYDANLQQLALSNKDGNADEHILSDVLPAERYYVQVWNASDGSSEAYHLRAVFR